MMDCAGRQAQIDAYVDGELPESEVRDLEMHLRDCSSCSAQALAASQLKRSVHFAGKAFAPDPELRRKIEGSMRPKPSRWQWIPQAALALAAIAIFAFGSLLWLRHRESRQLIGELTDLHVATLASANRVDVVSSDKHTVKPWFQGKVPFTFNLPDLEGTSFELIGGRMTYFQQNAGAELVFMVRKHVLSVFIFKDSAELDRALGSSAAQRNLAFNIESWTDDGLRYVVVTDAGRSDVDALRARFAAAAK